MTDTLTKSPHDFELAEEYEQFRAPLGQLDTIRVVPVVEGRESLTRFALSVEADELTREAGNNGNEINPAYLENNREVRKFFVDQIINGELYSGTVEDFTEKISQAHRIAAQGGVYEYVGKGLIGLKDEDVGKVREGAIYNDRLKAAKHAAHIAAQYGDAYALRFNKDGVMKVNLPGIPEEGWPDDTVTEGGSYEFNYPNPAELRLYFAEAQRIGAELQAAMQAPDVDEARVIELIGQQYQYLATARPFLQINNSLFMNLANAQLKLVGLKGIPHGQLDTVAQRLQPRTFTKYFKETVVNRQLYN